MARILAHTSKEGFYLRKQTTTVVNYFRDGSYYDTHHYQTYTGLSFKSPTQGSDGTKATSYSRCIIRAVGYPAKITHKSSGGFSEMDNSFGSWLTMSRSPWSQLSLAQGSVSPSAHLRLSAIAGATAKLHGRQAFILEDLAQSARTAREAYDVFKAIVKTTGRYLVVLNEAISFWDANHGIPSRRGGPKRQRHSADSWLRRLAKAWLAWYYGIKPLISTLNAIGAASKPRTRSIKVTSRHSSQLDPSSLYDHSAYYSANGYKYRGKCHEETTCRMHLDVVMSDDLAALASLGFTGGSAPFASDATDGYGDTISDGDVIVLGWALLPYSFVFDWIVPVEKFLSTLSWKPGITYKGGYISDYMGGSSECIVEDGAFGYTGKNGSMPKGRVEAVLFQRETYHNYPPPAALAVNQSISPINSLNAAALLLANFRR